MMQKRSIRGYQRMLAPKSDGLTCQLPITVFLEDDGTDYDDTRIDIHVSQSLNLCVPYIAVPDRCGRYVPLEIDSDLFPEMPQDTDAVRALKMRPFRLRLPPVIATQYRIAGLLQIPGYDSIPAIESGAVVRSLLARYDHRQRRQATAWTTAGPCERPEHAAA